MKLRFPPGLAWFLEARWRRWVQSPERLARCLPLHPGLRVVEIGTGTGYYARGLAAHVACVLAFDIQMAMLRQGLSRARPGNVHFTQADAAALPLADASCDLVYLVTVLGELPDPASMLREVRRILKPGGLLSISEHFPDPDYVSFGRLVELCGGAGFKLEARFGGFGRYTANFCRQPLPSSGS